MQPCTDLGPQTASCPERGCLEADHSPCGMARAGGSSKGSGEPGREVPTGIGSL